MSPKDIVHAWHTEWRINPENANTLYLHQDIKVLLPGKDAIKGWDAANTHFLNVASAVNLPQPYTADENKYLIYLEDKDFVARRFRCTYHNKDGTTMDMMVYNIYRIKDQKILHFEEYFDTYYRRVSSVEDPTQQVDLSEYLLEA